MNGKGVLSLLTLLLGGSSVFGGSIISEKRCPKCGLLNFATARKYDCGFDFGSGRMPIPALQKLNQKIIMMFAVGFACWFVLYKGYWLIVWRLAAPVASQMGLGGDVIVLFACILSVLINIIALVIFCSSCMTLDGCRVRDSICSQRDGLLHDSCYFSWKLTSSRMDGSAR